MDNTPATHLRVIVAIWLTNGHKPVDGANEPREFIASDWMVAREVTEALVDEGMLRWANEAAVLVNPTAAGVFQALSALPPHGHDLPPYVLIDEDRMP